MIKRKKFLIGGVILLLAIGYLAYAGFAGSTTYYFTVGELLERKDTLNSAVVRVNGQVVEGSLQPEAQGQVLRFIITDGNNSLPVVYQGVVPDAFKAGNDTVVEGNLTPDGVFQARTLMPKCPSKYTPQQG